MCYLYTDDAQIYTFSSNLALSTQYLFSAVSLNLPLDTEYSSHA